MIPKGFYPKTLKKNKKKQKHFRMQSSELLTVEYPLKSKRKKSATRSHKRSASSLSYNLVPLSGKTIITAPKIYSNQIFNDVYDEKGNHDRVVDLSTESDHDYNPMQNYISPELLQLPTAGRNLYNTRKVLFF